MMQLHSKTLNNGLRIRLVEMPGTNVVTSLVLVGAGSRYEEKEISGISHFLEHMFFKGGEKYTTPKMVSETIDTLGAEFNAFTSKEFVGYYVKSGKQHIDTSLDVLSDMLISAKFPPEEIEKERGVILEEMAMYLDLPIYQVGWDFENSLFGDQPIGRDEIGTKELITTVTQKDFFDYKNALYTPENTVVLLAGAVKDADISRIEKYFTFPDGKQSKVALPYDANLPTERFSIRVRPTEQYHLHFGVVGLSEEDDRYPAQVVLATILGGNMSSRMFQHVREELGLCYSIKTSGGGYSDVGVVSTRAGVKLGKVHDALAAIRHEYDLIATSGVTAEELKSAKSFLCGKEDLQTEDTEQVALFYGLNQLLRKKDESFEDVKQKITAVTKEDIDALAKELFTKERYNLALIGPEIDEEKARQAIS